MHKHSQFEQLGTIVGSLIGTACLNAPKVVFLDALTCLARSMTPVVQDLLKQNSQLERLGTIAA